MPIQDTHLQKEVDASGEVLARGKREITGSFELKIARPSSSLMQTSMQTTVMQPPLSFLSCNRLFPLSPPCETGGRPGTPFFFSLQKARSILSYDCSSHVQQRPLSVEPSLASELSVTRPLPFPSSSPPSTSSHGACHHELAEPYQHRHAVQRRERAASVGRKLIRHSRLALHRRARHHALVSPRLVAQARCLLECAVGDHAHQVSDEGPHEGNIPARLHGHDVRGLGARLPLKARSPAQLGQPDAPAARGALGSRGRMDGAHNSHECTFPGILSACCDCSPAGDATRGAGAAGRGDLSRPSHPSYPRSLTPVIPTLSHARPHLSFASSPSRSQSCMQNPQATPCTTSMATVHVPPSLPLARTHIPLLSPHRWTT